VGGGAGGQGTSRAARRTSSRVGAACQVVLRRQRACAAASSNRSVAWSGFSAGTTKMNRTVWGPHTQETREQGNKMDEGRWGGDPSTSTEFDILNP